ncbi:MAG: hypothetical protein EOP11_04055 [Proteobacteria bacterium]|nr:MAG: hypothetical protein EOP11_04055 [Pseudomonadota bacterium]
MRKLSPLLLALVLSACSSMHTEEAVPLPPPDPSTVMLPETPKLVVEAQEEGNNFVLISKRGEQELDRLSLRKIKFMKFDAKRECLFDSPANEVDYQIAAFVLDKGRDQAPEDYEPELYSVYGAHKNTGKLQNFAKRSASCYFMAP